MYIFSQEHIDYILNDSELMVHKKEPPLTEDEAISLLGLSSRDILSQREIDYIIDNSTNQSQLNMYLSKQDFKGGY